MVAKLPLSKVDHVGVIVKDIDKAIGYYELLGIGPFESFDAVSIKKTLMGNPIALDSIKVKIKMAPLPPIKMELVQPLEGASFWWDFLQTKGEGVNHIAYEVDDIDTAEAMLVKQGYRVLYTSRFKNGGGDTYFDTGEVGGVLTELLQWPPQ